MKSEALTNLQAQMNLLFATVSSLQAENDDLKQTIYHVLVWSLENLEQSSSILNHNMIRRVGTDWLRKRVEIVPIPGSCCG